MIAASLLQAFVLLFALVAPSNAQESEPNACTCSPTEFAFTINFDGLCEERDVMRSDALERVRCIVSDLEFEAIEPEVPTIITQIDILEFGFNDTLLSSTMYPGPFENGDSFDFTSITGTPTYDGEDVPQILQISLTALNEEGEMVRNILGVIYTNACNVEPVFELGASFGWVIFANFSDPVPEFCQAQPTAAPVVGPPTPPPEPTAECSCSPLEFNFRFDFSGECPGNIGWDVAIERVGCVIGNDFGDQVSDNTPTRVIRITIQEVTSTGSVVEEDITDQLFADGDIFTYTSIADTGSLIPVSLQIVVEGENNVGVGVFNVNLFEYTNECGAEVVFNSDAAVGWLQIEGFEPAAEEACQARTEPPTSPPTASPTPGAQTAPPTARPTTQPTSSPTPPPTEAPTPAPTRAPSDAPTPAPTEAPTSSPTLAPTEAPTPSPTDVPTQGPTLSPTLAPTVTPPTTTPTLAPTEAPPPTLTPTLSPTAAPTPSPTLAPTEGPTRGPTVAPTPGSQTPPPVVVPTPSPTTLVPTLRPSPLLTFVPSISPTDESPTQNPSAAQPPAQPRPPTPAPTIAETMSISFNFQRLLVEHEMEYEMGEDDSLSTSEEEEGGEDENDGDHQEALEQQQGASLNVRRRQRPSPRRRRI